MELLEVCRNYRETLRWRRWYSTLIIDGNGLRSAIPDCSSHLLPSYRSLFPSCSNLPNASNVHECKNGERSLSVPFTREDTAPAKPEDKSQDADKDTGASQDVAGEGAEGNHSPKKATKSKLTQDFRTEKGFAGFGSAVQRGDLVMFDVVLNRG